MKWPNGLEVGLTGSSSLVAVCFAAAALLVASRGRKLGGGGGGGGDKAVVGSRRAVPGGGRGWAGQPKPAEPHAGAAGRGGRGCRPMLVPVLQPDVAPPSARAHQESTRACGMAATSPVSRIEGDDEMGPCVQQLVAGRRPQRYLLPLRLHAQDELLAPAPPTCSPRSSAAPCLVHRTHFRGLIMRLARTPGGRAATGSIPAEAKSFSAWVGRE
jgi:hypothetical protein